MKTSKVTAFSLVELLAVLLLFLAVISRQDAEIARELTLKTQVVEEQVRALRGRLDREGRRRQRLIEEKRRSEAEVERLRGEYGISNIPPPCEGWLAEVEIIGPNTFILGGRPLTGYEIADLFGDEIAAASQSGCVHRIRASPGRSLSLKEYLRGLAILERSFYVKRIGS